MLCIFLNTLFKKFNLIIKIYKNILTYIYMCFNFKYFLIYKINYKILKL
jgi:hypothetical protein